MDKKFTFTGALSNDMKHIIIDNAVALSRILYKYKQLPLQVKIEPTIFKRSSAQNRWLWGVSHPTVCAFLKETQGEDYDKTLIHDFTNQNILNSEAGNGIICFTSEEFDVFCEDMYIMAKKYEKPSFISKIKSFIKGHTINLAIKKVLDYSVVTSNEKTSSSKLSTVEFMALKDKLQKFWAERGCIIPDPNQNNFTSDHINK